MLYKFFYLRLFSKYSSDNAKDSIKGGVVQAKKVHYTTIGLPNRLKAISSSL